MEEQAMELETAFNVFQPVRMDEDEDDDIDEDSEDEGEDEDED